MPASLNDTVITVVLPDNVVSYAGKYELRLGECTGLDDLDVRRATGFTLWGLVGQVGEEGGMNLVLATAVAWLVRRRTSPHVTFEMVSAAVSWGDDFEVIWGEPQEEVQGEGQGSESDTQASSEPSPTSTE